MVIKREGSRTVLAAAKQRITNAFSNGKKVYVSFSGGKDSLCLLDMVLKLVAFQPYWSKICIESEGEIERLERIRENLLLFYYPPNGPVYFMGYQKMEGVRFTRWYFPLKSIYLGVRDEKIPTRTIEFEFKYDSELLGKME